jgi:hypothetical protein
MQQSMLKEDNCTKDSDYKSRCLQKLADFDASTIKG